MKPLSLCLLMFFLLTGCIPDSFTNWNLAPPSSSTSGDGVTPPPGEPGSSVPLPPTSVTYTPQGPYEFNLTNDASATIPDLVPISTSGGEITDGYITFTLNQVKDINGVATQTVWPNSLSLNPNTGVISGRPNQFVNHNIYTIKATPVGAVSQCNVPNGSICTDIVLSMATKPESIFYPQKNGQVLLLTVSKPQNFAVGNSVSSQNNAKGTVTSIDQNNKIIYITVNCSGPNLCPTFNIGDKIDNKSSFFIEQSIIDNVVYGFTTSVGINNLIPIVNPTKISSEQPLFAISPDITTTGISFNSSTGAISGSPSSPLPNTKYVVTVKNVINQTLNGNISLQVLSAANPISPDKVEYAYSPHSRVVLEVNSTAPFQQLSKIANKAGTVATVADTITQLGQTDGLGKLLIDIDAFSISCFNSGEMVDNGYPYILAATSLTEMQPILVHQIGRPFSWQGSLSPNLSIQDKEALNWTTEPELPHLCQSIASTPTVYYKENTNSLNDPASCINAHGQCSISTITNGFACTTAAATWTTSAKYLSEYANELWFNRKTGEFGAFFPQQTFVAQTFDISVTSLTGVVVKTKTAISFEDVPKNLSYASDVLLEVDDFSVFNVGDQITSDGNGVGVITYKFNSAAPLGTPTYPGSQNILLVRTSSGEFKDGEDIDNVYPFTYQKGEIIKAKYNSLGIKVNANINVYQPGMEVSITSPQAAKGIINFVEPIPLTATATQGNLWVRLIDTKVPIYSFTTQANPLITGNPGNVTANILGILADNITINQNSATAFYAGADVVASPTEGFAMANSVTNFDVSVSVEKGVFTPGNQLYKYNPWNSTATGQTSSPINYVYHNPIFFLDRYGTSGIQPVIDSPENNGVSYVITPNLPTGLSFDSGTGQITVVAPGPVASVLKNYTVVASNFLGSTSYTFGLAVREVFSITDVTDKDGNISGILHKSGQGYSRFPCRITQEQIKYAGTGSSRGKNINCLYDVGEGDLYLNGLSLQVNVGSNLCVYVENVPYFFYQSQYIQTIPDPATPVMEHTGDYLNNFCAPSQPNGTIAQYPNGPPANRCLGNLSGVQCDNGTVSMVQRSYTVQGVCYDNQQVLPSGSDQGNPVPGVTDFTTCFGNPNINGSTAGAKIGNRAYCSNGAAVNRSTCLSQGHAWNSNYAWINNECYYIQPETDSVTCGEEHGSCSVAGNTDRTSCLAATGVWTTTGIYVNQINCFSAAAVPSSDYQCGGEQINCINGPAKDDPQFPSSSLLNRFNNYLRGYALKVTGNPIPFNFSSPDSKNYQSNIYISNFSRQKNAVRTNACTPYNGNVYEYNMSTWFNIGYNLRPNPPPVGSGINSPFSGGNGVYAIRCLDAASNIIAQINLLVREWDRDFKAKDNTDMMDYAGSLVDSATATEPDFGYPYNTYKDWDDSSIGGSCSAPTYSFPGQSL